MWGGGNLAEVTFKPFGEPRVDVGRLAGTDKTYTGQRDVPDTGLMDYRARMYSAQLGRFIQPDTIVPGAGNSQAWNRYAYGLNNPVRYIDPSGHKACVDWDNNGQCVVDPDWHGKNNPIPKDPYKKGKNGNGVTGGNRFGGQVTISGAGFPELPDYVWPSYPSMPNGYEMFRQTNLIINTSTTYRFDEIIWSPFFDLSATWVDIVEFLKKSKIPGSEFIGFGLSYVSQYDRDVKLGVQSPQIYYRAGVVGVEQVAIGIVSIAVATEIVGSSRGIGLIPGVVVYLEMSGVLSYLAGEVNNQVIFPFIEENITDK